MRQPVATRAKTKIERAAIVTGGAGEGIGHGITEVLAENGWAVLVVDRDAPTAAALSSRLGAQGYRVEALVADLTARSTPQRAVAAAKKAFGRIDGLVNNAVIGLCKPVAEVSDAEFDRLLDLDLKAAFRMTRAAIPAMTAGGAIVNIGSVHARETMAGYGIYAAIKASLEGFTRGLAADYGPRKIRANCVHPGYVESPQNRALIRRFTSDPDAWIARYVATKQLLPQVVSPRDVGELVAWLLGDKSATVTGQAFVIDSGTTAMLFEREVKS